jgi:hypothetical protein
MTTEDRDRILQLVSYVNTMHYHAKQPMMDGSNYGKMQDALEKAKKLCVPVVNSLDPNNLHEGYYAVSWDDDDDYSAVYVRFGECGSTWGWDQEDDPEMIPEGAAIFINGQKRYAREFRKEQP